jgi:hypothetical protein
MEEMRDWLGKKEPLLLEGSQALPASPSDTASMKVKTREWLEAVTWDRGPGILTNGSDKKAA